MIPTKLAAQFGLTKAAYSRRETKEILSLGQTKVDAMVASGELKSVKLGKEKTAKRLILANSIAEVLARGLTPSHP